jgi:hypothetical protein
VGPVDCPVGRIGVAIEASELTAGPSDMVEFEIGKGGIARLGFSDAELKEPSDGRTVVDSRRLVGFDTSNDKIPVDPSEGPSPAVELSGAVPLVKGKGGMLVGACIGEASGAVSVRLAPRSTVPESVGDVV